jgi:adenosylcobinamide-GDP ribazoletransferase
MIGLFLFLIKTVSVSLGSSIWITATLILLILTIASGGLHLDGLGDVCDGFYAGRTREEKLQIMRDPHIGVMGVIGIIFTILIKWTILISLPNGRYSSAVLILMPLISRWSMVIAAFFGPYVHPVRDSSSGRDDRSSENSINTSNNGEHRLESSNDATSISDGVQIAEEGVGKPFVENITLKEVIIATIITLGVSIYLANIIGFLLIPISFISVFIMVLISRRILGGINGDVIGAINEIIEILVLFLIYWIYIIR